MDRSQVKPREVAARIPLDYYKKPDSVFKAKGLLWKIAAAGTVVWIITMLAPGKTPVVGANRFSHGEVCKAHATFGHECSACHVNFAMLGGKETNGAFKGDSKCMECHLGHDGATHSPQQKVSMTPNCGVCHTDHKGVDFDIKRTSDKHCIVCHKDLPASMDGGQCKYAKDVTSFADNHPEFRSVKADPSKIKFNHKYHMTEGIVLAPGGKPFTFNDMAEGPMKTAFQERFKKPDAVITLQCLDCHTREEKSPLARIGEKPEDLLTDAAKKINSDFFAGRQENRGRRATGELQPPHVPGAYMAPINFDDNCAACHSLKFDANLPAVAHKQLDPRTKRLAPQDDQLALLRAEVERLVGNAKLPVLEPALRLGLPGKPPHVGKGNRFDAAMRSLLEGKRVCGECHVDASGSDLTVSSKKIAASNIPTEWFEHARFRHSPHKDMDCRDCHAQAYGSDKNKVWDEKGLMDAYMKPRKGAEDVMIPAIDNCRQCHSPKPTLSTPVPARHDCTECHGYHHGKGAAGK